MTTLVAFFLMIIVVVVSDRLLSRLFDTRRHYTDGSNKGNQGNDKE